jgi:hypothetical protein
LLVKRSSAHLRMAITSAKNTVERLPIDMFSLQSYEGPYIPAPKQFCIPDPSVYQWSTFWSMIFSGSCQSCQVGILIL